MTPLVLSRLPAAAPPTLVPRVLDAVGLATRYLARETGIGPVVISFTKVGIAAVRLASEVAGGAVDIDEHPPARLVAGIDAVLAGRKAGSTLRYDLAGLGDFARAVLTETATIPPGQVRPYGAIAESIGHPRAARAVGTALANNPIPLLIPCHRVVRNDGTLGNYGLGSPGNKRRLLEAEGAIPVA